jgi:hypothetical protein
LKDKLRCLITARWLAKTVRICGDAFRSLSTYLLGKVGWAKSVREEVMNDKRSNDFTWRSKPWLVGCSIELVYNGEKIT